MLKDKTYKILVKLLKTPMCSAEIAKYNTPVTSINTLMSRHFIDEKRDAYGEPLDMYYITDEGVEYVLDCLQKRSDFIRNFFSQFISGFFVGMLSTVAAYTIMHLIGII